MRKVYIAGHMLTRGAQMQRAEERELVSSLGHQLYNPMDNKEINDKKLHKDDTGLAERIVKQDTDAIFWADTVLIEPLAEANGTLVELGQIKGMKDLAKKLMELPATNEIEFADQAIELLKRILDQKVVAHFEDIRRVEGITETGDRRSLGINQYVYGTVLDLTDGKGFTEFKDLPEALA
ncbi:hypothetical protein [Escherichia phage PJNS034]